MPQLDFETYNLKNARDLGGTLLQDGSSVKAKMLIRSCALGQATSEEIEQLEAHYDPRYIIDLRAADEAKKDPDPMDLLPNAQYVNIPLASDDAVGVVRKGGLKEALELGKRMAEDPVGMMTSMYADIVSSERGKAAMRKVFDILLKANGKCVLWHCTAGKDRAGITAAMILLALGASRKTVYDDYLLTNNYMEPYLEKQRKQLRFAPRKVKDSLAIVNAADIRFMDAAFDAIEAQSECIEKYFTNDLRLTEVELRALKQTLTESPTA